MIECSSLWASSSMAEQWPFKPLVESSSLSSLTKSLPFWRLFLFLCSVPTFNPLLESFPFRGQASITLLTRAFHFGGFFIIPNRRDYIIEGIGKILILCKKKIYPGLLSGSSRKRYFHLNEYRSIKRSRCNSHKQSKKVLFLE